jgi:tetratricopeptide (TPR) repeat protein
MAFYTGENPFVMGIMSLLSDRPDEALECFREAVEETGSPVASSYLAYCLARQNGTYRDAIYLCMEALKEEPRSPEIFLNLGRIYIMSGHKRSALRSFQLGLRYGYNTEIAAEMKNLGLRQRPPFPFLPRNHAINKFMGKFLSRLNLRKSIHEPAARPSVPSKVR